MQQVVDDGGVLAAVQVVGWQRVAAHGADVVAVHRLADQFGVIETDAKDPTKIAAFREKPKDPVGLADSPDEVLAVRSGGGAIGR